MNYHLLREIADSWVLLALTLFFVAAVAWAWRPGSRRAHDDSAAIPFRHDDRPAPAPAPQGGATAQRSNREAPAKEASK
jgi:cytochrome c oxidase cbb3-type subunit IV